ncbi:hypothetical protein FHR21_002567 [Sphingopyxis panaciterrulae]|uniref:Uncharacterized protein n=1 Tax=Sphingopyxis panaciterrulae TaxID=462372 RepID=A0A7W9ER56_9SPHN|nr:hypothetical protein [Sphingopyxis panaciterrulae]
MHFSILVLVGVPVLGKKRGRKPDFRPAARAATGAGPLDFTICIRG